MAGREVSTVARILSYQILIIGVVGMAFLAGGAQKAVSSVLGGLAAFIPNVYFALRVRNPAGREAREILNSFYKGEFIKLILTAVLFILILKIPDVEVLPLFAGYASALTVFWFALLMR